MKTYSAKPAEIEKKWVVVDAQGIVRGSPVAGATIVNGLVPCNVIADEILTAGDGQVRALVTHAGRRIVGCRCPIAPGRSAFEAVRRPAGGRGGVV